MQSYETLFNNVRERSLAFMRMYWRHILIAFVVILVLLLGVSLVSYRALPGESLYGFKTRIVEPTAHVVRFTPRMQASHSIDVLERRLKELEALQNDSATSTPETLGNFAWLVQREVDRANSALLRSGSPEKALDLHLKILSTADAHQTIVRSSEEFWSVEETIEDARGNAYRGLETTARNFASTSAEAAGSYLGDQLRVLEAELGSVASGSDAETRATARLSDAQDAIAQGDLGDAIVFVLRARQAIAVDQYLFDSERGPQRGVTPETPTTEGQ